MCVLFPAGVNGWGDAGGPHAWSETSWSSIFFSLSDHRLSWILLLWRWSKSVFICTSIIRIFSSAKRLWQYFMCKICVHLTSIKNILCWIKGYAVMCNSKMWYALLKRDKMFAKSCRKIFSPIRGYLTTKITNYGILIQMCIHDMLTVLVGYPDIVVWRSSCHLIGLACLHKWHGRFFVKCVL